MKTPDWLKWAFGDDMDVKEIVIFAAAVIIVLNFAGALAG